MLIGIEQLRCLLAPFRCDIALADQTLRPHLENVREIAAQRQLKRETDTTAVVVVDIKVLVNAAGHGAAENEADARRLYLAAFAYDLRIDQVGARGVVG